MQNQQMAAMAGMQHAGGPVGGTPMLSDTELPNPGKQLNTYIYDYFLRNNYKRLARAMLQENLELVFADPNEKPMNLSALPMFDESKDGPLPRPKVPQVNAAENSFLLDWWGQFWEVYSAARTNKGNNSSVARQYLAQSRGLATLNANERQQRMVMQQNNNMQYQRFMGNNMNGVPAKDHLRAAAAMNNRPNNPNQMANMAQMKNQALMSAQMQRDGSGMDMNGQRPQSPSSNENAPSPNKRPRVEGGMNASNMPGNQFGEFGQTSNMQQKSLEGLNPGMQQGSPLNAPGLDGQGDAFAGNRPHLPQGAGQTQGNHALQDYQMQLMLLEQQNKKRLLMARQEQDTTMSQGPGPHGQPAVGGPGFAQAMSPQGSRAGPSPNPADQIKRGTPKMNQQGLPGSPMPDAAMQQNRNSPVPPNFDPNIAPPGAFYPAGVQMPGGTPMMRPPSSHPQFNGQQFNPQAQMEAMRANGMQNGAWRQGQQPGMMQPGQQPGPMGNPQARNPMPPPPAPTGEQPGRTQEPSPSQPAAAPPTPNQSNKPNPQKKGTKETKKKPAKKNAATTGATPASDADPPPTPTPSTPITPMHPNSFNPKGPNGQAQPQQPPQPQGQAPQVQPPPMDTTGAFGGMTEDNNFDINFGTLEGPDVLESFDFDSFLHTEDNGTFGALGGDFNFTPDGVEATGDL